MLFLSQEPLLKLLLLPGIFSFSPCTPNFLLPSYYLSFKTPFQPGCWGAALSLCPPQSTLCIAPSWDPGGLIDLRALFKHIPPHHMQEPGLSIFVSIPRASHTLSLKGGLLDEQRADPHTSQKAQKK